MNNFPRIWITGPGRSGTTILHRILCRWWPGINEAAGHEPPAFTQVNERLITEVYGIKPGRWPWVPPSRTIADAFDEKEWQDEVAASSLALPHLAKDPRLLLTWPIWLGAAEVLPSYLLVIDRDTDECAHSWNRSADSHFELTRSAVEYRQRRIPEMVDAFQAAGIEVLRLQHPRDLYQASVETGSPAGALTWFMATAAARYTNSSRPDIGAAREAVRQEFKLSNVSTWVGPGPRDRRKLTEADFA